MFSMLLASLATPAIAQSVPDDGVLECDDTESTQSTWTTEGQLERTWGFFLALEDCDTDPLRLLGKEVQGTTIRDFVANAVQDVEAQCLAEIAVPHSEIELPACPETCAGGALTVAEIGSPILETPLVPPGTIAEHTPFHTCLPGTVHWQDNPIFPCFFEVTCTATCTQAYDAQISCEPAPVVLKK